MNNLHPHYLQALGIQVWQLKQEPEAVVTMRPETADAWGSLEQAVAACQACGLQKTRTQTVFGVGNRNAELMIIGEAPGENEDKQGQPFVGRAGLLLTSMLEAIGYERDEVFIANILKCRPPGNRDPEPQEVEHCTPFLKKQIALVQPKILLAVGRIAAQYLLNTKTAVSKLRGTLHEYEGIPLVVTFHPAYLLRSPKEKSKAFQDLQYVQSLIPPV